MAAKFFRPLCLGVIAYLSPFVLWSQTFSGTVIDSETKEPIEFASVYFDNTTIGTTTNTEGEFTIGYTDAIKSSLIISYIGYKSQNIVDYRVRDNLVIALESDNVLD